MGILHAQDTLQSIKTLDPLAIDKLAIPSPNQPFIGTDITILKAIPLDGLSFNNANMFNSKQFLLSQAQKKPEEVLLLEPYSLVPSPEKNSKVKEVDNSKYFRKEIAIQKVGSCHIYTAVALAEAYCKKTADLDFKLSEEYYFYRFIRDFYSSRPIKDNLVEDFGLIERGFSHITLNRMRSGDIALQRDFKDLKEDEEGSFEYKSREIIQNHIGELQKSISEKMKFQASQASSEASEILSVAEKVQSEVFDKTPIVVASAWDNAIQNRSIVQMNESANKVGLQIPTETVPKDVSSCLSKIPELKDVVNPSKEKMMELVDEKSFFTCKIDNPKSYVPLFSNIYPFVRYHNGPDSFVHVAIVYGYRKLNNKVEFMVRDSNSKEWPGYVVTTCNSIGIL